MRSSIALLLAATLVAAPHTADAQTFTSNVSGTPATVIVGQWAFTHRYADMGWLAGGPNVMAFDLFGSALVGAASADFQNAFVDGETYAANVTLLSSDAAAIAARTRIGQLLGGDEGITRYTKMIWLAVHIETTPECEWPGIQGALWRLETAEGTPTAAANWDVQFWLDQLAGADLTTIDPTGFAVVTDVNTVDGVGGSKEFLIRANVVPEPSTYLLLASGMLGLAAIARRRRPAVN